MPWHAAWAPECELHFCHHLSQGGFLWAQKSLHNQTLWPSAFLALYNFTLVVVVEVFITRVKCSMLSKQALKKVGLGADL